jgi:hypothetical protein
VQMLNAKLVFVLKLLEFFFWCLLVVFLIFGRRFNALFEALTNKQYLAILVVNIFWLDLTPRQAAKLLDDSVDGQSWIASMY